MTGARDSQPELAGALEAVEETLLGSRPHLTRGEVAALAGVPIQQAEQLWRLLGFPHAADDDRAFTESDVQALRLARDLIRLGVIGPDSQAALVRTWGRSFARLAEWQTRLLADLALDLALDAEVDAAAGVTSLAGEVLPRLEALQAYAWRRHLASAASRLLTVGPTAAGSLGVPLAVCFVDIVGYTSRSKSLSEAELVAWLERFESEATLVVVEAGGRIIKTIGDEVLFVAEDPVGAAEAALQLTARGQDDDDPFPAVRAGLAYGEVLARLGDVFGPVVNVASRLTSLARPGAVLVDQGAYEVLSGLTFDDVPGEPTGTAEPGASLVPEAAGEPAGPDAAPEAAATYRFRRLRRTSVKGYAKLPAWVLRPA
ncbi:adenylate/guanylate cyclase domain-containing protein [Nocardioides ferulae]|uniref:adenylate/guanylate cyclase domain-containing protein n=1 Tax=Nocardioides ferulae TaxID=2340821 RepID=UPI001F0B88B2|nr:adenylate/guanylate cyclase domain-containing protein [Nocardioides ferulae]